jgi:uncharacterized protein
MNDGPETMAELDAALHLTTFSGREIKVFRPDPQQIALTDIARALAMQCRYAGQVERFYSVAEHSVIVSLHLDTEGLGLAGLLHDAAEAYVGDLIRPVKHALRSSAAPRFAQVPSVYDRIEAAFCDAIAERFGLPQGFQDHPRIKTIDAAACAMEQTAMRTMRANWHPPVEPLAASPLFLSPKHAERSFLDRAHRYGIR